MDYVHEWKLHDLQKINKNAVRARGRARGRIQRGRPAAGNGRGGVRRGRGGPRPRGGAKPRERGGAKSLVHDLSSESYSDKSMPELDLNSDTDISVLAELDDVDPDDSDQSISSDHKTIPCIPKGGVAARLDSPGTRVGFSRGPMTRLA